MWESVFNTTRSSTRRANTIHRDPSSTEANTQFHDQTLSVRTGGTLPRYLYTGSTKNERTHCLTVDTTATHPEHVRVTSEFRHARRAGARLSLYFKARPPGARARPVCVCCALRGGRRIPSGLRESHHDTHTPNRKARHSAATPPTMMSHTSEAGTPAHRRGTALNGLPIRRQT